jgi:hypothetical protein
MSRTLLPRDIEGVSEGSASQTTILSDHIESSSQVVEGKFGDIFRQIIDQWVRPTMTINYDPTLVSLDSSEETER